MKLLITGGAGFIGSAFVQHVLRARRDVLVVNLDKLTYAGNLDNLTEVAGDRRYRFVQGDICDAAIVRTLFESERPDVIVNFAAESHVDRSILSPHAAIQTNSCGAFALLEAARTVGVRRFIQISTDEVYGSLEPPLEADEMFPLNPSSAYSASKASADLLGLAYFKTYGVPVIVTRSSNNYGSRQFPEKLIPLMITNALRDLPLPVYGDGGQIRDWLHVEDHCRALLAVLDRGRVGDIYNIGGNRALPNIEVVRRILEITGRSTRLIRRVQDRPGHDRRYALSSQKLRNETGWAPLVDFDDGLEMTVTWYDENQAWCQRIESGAYREYYASNYHDRIEVLRRMRAAPAQPGERTSSRARTTA